MLVNPDGDWVFPGSPEFLEELGDPDPDYDSIAFAVKNLGYIKFQVVQQSIIEIELHPRNVELPALLAVQQQLQSSEIKLFRIKHLDAAWHSEISASAEHTIVRLSELCAPAFTPPSKERFTIDPRDFSEVLEDEDNELRPLAQKWRVSFGHFDPSLISLAMKQQLLPRLMIIGIKPRRVDPEWRFIGSGQRWLPRAYPFSGIGEKVENMPDREYGSWVSEFYKSVARTGQPRYDVVTAAMQYENEQGKPRRVVHYERLLLPWKTPSDEIFVTSCARLPNDNLSSSVASSG
jgi:hypothetical protein